MEEVELLRNAGLVLALEPRNSALTFGLPFGGVRVEWKDALHGAEYPGVVHVCEGVWAIAAL